MKLLNRKSINVNQLNCLCSFFRCGNFRKSWTYLVFFTLVFLPIENTFSRDGVWAFPIPIFLDRQAPYLSSLFLTIPGELINRKAADYVRNKENESNLIRLLVEASNRAELLQPTKGIVVSNEKRIGKHDSDLATALADSLKKNPIVEVFFRYDSGDSEFYFLRGKSKENVLRVVEVVGTSRNILVFPARLGLLGSLISQTLLHNASRDNKGVKPDGFERLRFAAEGYLEAQIPLPNVKPLSASDLGFAARVVHLIGGHGGLEEGPLATALDFYHSSLSTINGGEGELRKNDEKAVFVIDADPIYVVFYSRPTNGDVTSEYFYTRFLRRVNKKEFEVVDKSIESNLDQLLNDASFQISLFGPLMHGKKHTE